MFSNSYFTKCALRQLPPPVIRSASSQFFKRGTSKKLPDPGHDLFLFLDAGCADAGYMDEDGYVFVMSRTDDIINVSGHRLSTGGLEEVLFSHPDVADCAVFGVNDELKGQIPFGLLVLKSGVMHDPGTIVNEVVQMVRDTIGPVASFKIAVVVQRLPKTRSGKMLRGTMQKIANGDMYASPATIDDPDILAEIETAMAQAGYAKKHT